SALVVLTCGSVQAQDAAGRFSIEILPQRGHDIGAVKISARGNVIASSAGVNSIKLWDPRSGRLVRTLAKLPSDGRNFAQLLSLSPDGRRLLARVNDFKLWDSETGRIVLTMPSAYAESAMSRDGRRIVSANADEKSITVWDAEIGKKLIGFRTSSPITT